jgi:hypothetical protein
MVVGVREMGVRTKGQTNGRGGGGSEASRRRCYRKESAASPLLPSPSPSDFVLAARLPYFFPPLPLTATTEHGRVGSPILLRA